LFNTIPDLPEALLQGRKRILIQWFFQLRPRTLQAFSAKRTSTSTTECTAFEDMVQNADLAKARIKIPILALGGDVGSAPNIYDAIKPLGEDVQGGVIDNCGHYIPEEQPEILAQRMLAFFVE
jgi:pimeloyl-ACP methyl ester carboxylesterase